MNFIRPIFEKKHGTERGYVRYLLSLFDHYTGRIDNYNQIKPQRVKRVVFVCLGNICRSAYAHHYAIKHDLGMPVVSLGLSTNTGSPANEVAIETATKRGVDLTTHIATDLTDFDVQEGDLFLVMEIRQANKLSGLLSDYKDFQVALLGSYCQPIHPHLHDPYSLNKDYFNHCFTLIENAVVNLKKEFIK